MGGERVALRHEHRFVTSAGAERWGEVQVRAISGWDGLPTGPKMAQLTDVYGQAIEAAGSGKMSVKAALAKAQADGTAILKS